MICMEIMCVPIDQTLPGVPVHSRRVNFLEDAVWYYAVALLPTYSHVLAGSFKRCSSALHIVPRHSIVLARVLAEG